MNETNILYELTFGLFERFSNLCDSFVDFLHLEITIPVYRLNSAGIGFLSFETGMVLDLIGPLMIVCLISWLIAKILPIL